MLRRHPLLPVAAAAGATAPWLALVASGAAAGLGDGATIAVSGVAVLGASFVLAWAAETAEKDVPRSFALAVLAVVAVAPEYAVDALYAWEAGAGLGTPRGEQAVQLAVANMTGANRILIGVGWSAIAFYALAKARSTGDVAVEQRDGLLANRVHLDRDVSVEILFLGLATLWAFAVPLNGAIDALDTTVLVGLYVLYIGFALRGPVTVGEHVGVPAQLVEIRRRLRVPLVLGMFLFSLGVILVAVEPFAHGLEAIGPRFGISSFFMIQWVAPLASESPELVITAYLVHKARSTAAFNALISSKLNQWTLLIGTLVLVYSLALGRYGAMPLAPRQAGEIWLTAAQSFFAVALLLNFEISGREAAALLALFAIQLLPRFHEYDALLGFSALYMVLGAAVVVHRRRAVPVLVREVRDRTF